MILGIGIDLVEIAKIERSMQSPAFMRKVFTQAEVEDCASLKNKAERLAGKFAAKEAFMKAVGRGLRQGLWFGQIEVLHDEATRPYLKITGEAERQAQRLNVGCTHLSISHAGGMAAAIVILESP